ncbi:MAG: NADH-quinone oxidoreductase subunit J, partial [Cyclobacteriaceae bacterium]|nr:NADH-quinone oxidoreductase subunit J [Cyclobacteriaceae bacterium]
MMTFTEIFTVLMAILVLGASLAMVFSNNIIHAAFFLVLCLLGVAALYVVFESTYMAIVQIMVYAGGVIVLLIFGIMLVNRMEDGKLQTRHHLRLPAGLLGGGLLVLLVVVIRQADFFPFAGQVEGNQAEIIGTMFMTDYLLAFELVAYLLLVVLVG